MDTRPLASTLFKVVSRNRLYFLSVFGMCQNPFVPVRFSNFWFDRQFLPYGLLWDSMGFYGSSMGENGLKRCLTTSRTGEFLKMTRDSAVCHGRKKRTKKIKNFSGKNRESLLFPWCSRVVKKNRFESERKACQTICKPGSVIDDYSSAAIVADCL